MTLPLDSASQEGTQSQPSGEGSGKENVSSSGTVTVTKEDYDSLRATVKRLEDDNRSNKDKAVKKTNERLEKLEGEVKPLLERAAEYIAKGKSPTEAMSLVNSEQEAHEEKLVMRELVQAIRSGNLPVTNAQGNAQVMGVNLAEVIKTHQLDGNDPEVIAEILSKQWSNPLEAENAALKLVNRRLNPTPPSIGASTTIIGSAPAPAGIDQLVRDYQKEMLAAHGNRNSGREIKERYRKAGVNVDAVTFSV